MGSSQIRDGTVTPCIGKRSLNYWTTREVPQLLNFNFGCDSFTSQCFIILFTLQSGCFLLNHFKTVGIQLTLEQRRFDCLVPFTSGFFFFFLEYPTTGSKVGQLQVLLRFSTTESQRRSKPLCWSNVNHI